MIQLQPLLQGPLTALWQQPAFAAFTAERGYAQPATIQPGAVLFLGLATSYNQTHNVDGDPTQPVAYDLYDNPSAFYRKEIDFLTTVRPTLTYAHLDVLFQRESDPKVLQAALAGPAADFARAQLEVTQDLLRHLTQLPKGERPRAIVVTNRFAQELLGFFFDPTQPNREQWLGLTFTEQEVHSQEEPYYLCDEWGDTPVIFTIPLGGQSTRFNTPEKKAAKLARTTATLRRLLR